jgi:spore coat protein H
MKRLFLILLFCIAGLAWVSILKRHSEVVRRGDFSEFRIESSHEEEPPTIDPFPLDQDRVFPSATNLVQPSPPARDRPVRKSNDNTGEPSPVNSDLFTGAVLPRIQIEISRSGISALGRTDWQNKQDRPTVRATVREGNTVFTNVAVHLKGAAGSFQRINEPHPCFTLNFDKLAPGQRFHGLQKLSLNNSRQDGSYLSEKISRELFQAAGVPVPRAGHAKVSLNGRDLGLYVLTEGYNKQFLKGHFKNTKGNLYDGGFCQEITHRLSINSGDNPDNHSGLIELIKATKLTNSTQRFARMEEVLDMDRFLSFLAMDMILCNWDGYAINKNNWRLFHDLESNKMVFMPHGLDQMFGIPSGQANPNFPILRPMQGLVANRVISTPEGRRRYLERVGYLYTNVFHVREITKRVDEMARAIGVNPNGLKKRIEARGESLKSQLATIIAPQPLNAASAATKLIGWQSRVKAGQPGFRPQSHQEGVGILYITASGNSVGSWRTSVVLDPGRYRFEGKIRTKDVKPGSGGAINGALLRISGGAVSQGITGSSDEWKSFAYPFQVTEDKAEVELVCELQASKGEAAFDTASLRVIPLR